MESERNQLRQGFHFLARQSDPIKAVTGLGQRRRTTEGDESLNNNNDPLPEEEVNATFVRPLNWLVSVRPPHDSP